MPVCRLAKNNFSRFFSSSSSLLKAAQQENATPLSLFLPKTSFPLWPDLSEVDKKYRLEICDQLYKQQKAFSQRPVFVLHDGPPYANGNLHMGHALNKIIKDIINRFQLSLGRRVHYVPGWDCHGLPIENKALQQLDKDSLSVHPDIIRMLARKTAMTEIESQKDQFRPLGVMADWDDPNSTYRTLDSSYELNQLRIFQIMVNKGLIYRHYRPVHYSPSSRSALAEAELIYRDDHVSHSVFVTFDIARQASFKSAVIQEIVAAHPKVKFLVWTTTPWTLTANMGIAVHRDMVYVAVRANNEVAKAVIIVAKERLEALRDVLGPIEIIATVPGSELIDVQYHSIFSNLSSSYQPLKVIGASHVNAEAGTGLVHCAPAHGVEDYNAFKAIRLISTAQSILCHVDKAGNFSSEVAEVVGEEAASGLVGKEVLNEGSRAVVELLKQNGALVKIQRIKHRYPYDWKTDRPIIVTATSQWFANLDRIKGNALSALQDVKFFPASSRNRLESFVESRSEWCISRQRAWGVPIPALYRISTDEVVLDPTTLDHIMNVLKERGVDYWWHGPVADFVPPSLLQEGIKTDTIWRKGTDTMDVWFDSGTSWTNLPARVGGKPRAEVCVEGSDQHRGWFQSQLLTAIGSTHGEPEPVKPYGTLITHGMVLDEKGKKMSKSLGNIISPMSVVFGGENLKTEPAYGADVLRLWVATVEYWRDMSFGKKALSQASESMRKIRNSFRFLLANIGEESARPSSIQVVNLSLADRYVMHELYTLEQIALEGYASYNFPKVVNALNNFANITLSSLYFDITKDCLYANQMENPDRMAIVAVLEQTLSTMLSVVNPVLPFLAAEVRETWKPEGGPTTLTPWRPLESKWQDIAAASDMTHLLRIRSHVLSLLENARRNKQITSSLGAEVDIFVPDGMNLDNDILRLLQREESFLKTLFIVSDVSITDEGSLGTSSPEWVYSDTVSIPGTEDELGLRVRPATLSKCPRCWTYTCQPEQSLCSRCNQVERLQTL